MCSWFYWPLTLKYWTEGNEPEKIFMSKKVEQLSHSHMWNHHHRPMVFWRSKQSKEQHFLESIQMISKQILFWPNFIWNDVTPVHSSASLEVCTENSHTVCKNIWNIVKAVQEWILREWVCVGLEQHDPTLSCQMRNECWDSQLFVELVSSCTGDMSRGTAENRSNDSFMMKSFSKCQPNAAIYMRMALPHSWRRPGW